MVEANNLQQSWRFDWEPPKAVLRDVRTVDWIFGWRDLQLKLIQMLEARIITPTDEISAGPEFVA